MLHTPCPPSAAAETPIHITCTSHTCGFWPLAAAVVAIAAAASAAGWQLLAEIRQLHHNTNFATGRLHSFLDIAPVGDGCAQQGTRKGRHVSGPGWEGEAGGASDQALTRINPNQRG